MDNLQHVIYSPMTQNLYVDEIDTEWVEKTIPLKGIEVIPSLLDRALEANGYERAGDWVETTRRGAFMTKARKIR